MKQALQLGAMSAANMVSNILFQWLVLTILGPGMDSDALFAGMTVPQLFAVVIGASLTHVLVPILAGEPDAAQRRDGWTLLAICGAGFCMLAALLIATAGWWVPFTVPGFGQQGKELTISIARISLLGIVFTGLNSVQAAMAYARRNYLWADAAPMVANLLAVLCLFWALPRYGVIAAAWISVARLLVQTMLLQVVMGPPVALDLRAAVLPVIWRKLAPMLVGASYYKLDPLVDRILLSSAQAGSLSLLYMAQQVYAAGSQVIAKALAVPAITEMATAHKSGETGRYRRTLRVTSLKVAMICILGVLCLALIGRPVLALLMNHGNFGPAQTYLLWLLLLLMSGQFIAGSMGSLTAGAFYARGDTLTPTVLGSIAFTLGVALKVLMFKLFGLFGLAVAISAYYCFSLGLQLAILWRRGLYAPGHGVGG